MYLYCILLQYRYSLLLSSLPFLAAVMVTSVSMLLKTPGSIDPGRVGYCGAMLEAFIEMTRNKQIYYKAKKCHFHKPLILVFNTSSSQLFCLFVIICDIKSTQTEFLSMKYNHNCVLWSALFPSSQREIH